MTLTVVRCSSKVGDLGSNLPPLDTGTMWKMGSDVEVAWALRAWHGGGYTYRLCPAESPLTEECFQNMNLKFNGNSSLRWGGIGGEELSFSSDERGWEVSTGTVLAGSTWRKIPIPRTANEWMMYGANFEPVCAESKKCSNSTSPREYRKAAVCKCSGDWNDQVKIVDRVRIPAGLKPGKYVLGWRWDCEESAQVWTSCSDVTIK